GAADEQITPADPCTVLILRSERLIRVTADTPVAAGVEALRWRQLLELRCADRAVLAAEQHPHALAERAHDVRARMEPPERRAGSERVAAAAQVHGPRVPSSRDERIVGDLARQLRAAEEDRLDGRRGERGPELLALDAEVEPPLEAAPRVVPRGAERLLTGLPVADLLIAERAAQREEIGQRIALARNAIFGGDRLLDARQTQIGRKTVPARVDAAQLDAEADARPGVGAVAEADGVLLRAPRRRAHDDRDVVILGALALDVDHDVAEIAAVVQRDLQLQEPVGIERLAAANRHEAFDEALVQDVLLDRDVAEVIAGAGIELEVDGRLAPRTVHAQLGAPVHDVDEACVVRRIEQRLLRGLVARMSEHLTGRERDRLPSGAHRRVVGAFANDADVDLGDRRRRAGIDDVARDPIVAVALERRRHGRLVVSERLQRGRDLAFRRGVQPADPRLRRVLVVLRGPV